MSYNTDLQANNTDLQAILDAVNALPDAGTALPELTNPASEAEVFEGYEVIDVTGAKKTGTFTLTNELSEQETLLAQLDSALSSKASGGGVDTCTVNISTTDGGYINKIAYLTTDENGDIVTVFDATRSTSRSVECVCNSFVCVALSAHVVSLCTNANELGYMSGSLSRIYQITAAKEGVATIRITTAATGGAD